MTLIDHYNEVNARHGRRNSDENRDAPRKQNQD